MNSLRLLILGATGGTGRKLLAQALERGHHVTALVRSPDKLAPRDRLKIAGGNPLDERTLRALGAHDAVISVVGPPGPGQSVVMRECARACVAAMTAVGARRLVAVSVALLFRDAGWLAAVLRRTVLRGTVEDAAAMEQIITESSLDWTIVRPPRLTNNSRSEGHDLAVDHLPSGAGSTATLGRDALARFLIEEAERPAHVRQIVGIAASTHIAGDAR
ncbi:MAG: NAD(P)H-binding protein [Kofleriaceae bacterium]|nr:NAD(P)H-binding protein [Kofleriaceae bacterium]